MPSNPMIPRAQVFALVAQALPPGEAEDVFRRSLEMSGIPDKGAFTPDELSAISGAMLDLAARAANKAAQDIVREELFGPAPEVASPTDF
jgi:hypothetical protein